MITVDDEKGWVQQSQNGDHEAFAALIRAHQRMIHSLTFRMTGSLADAEDLAQETFIRAFAQLASFEGKAKFSSWLYRIAINACLNWRERETRRSQVHSDWAMSTSENSSDSAPTTGKSDLSLRAQEALMKLPAKQRIAIILTVHDGLNHAQAAKVLQCAETTVSWRVYAAKRKLKHWLSAKGGAL